MYMYTLINVTDELQAGLHSVFTFFVLSHYLLLVTLNSFYPQNMSTLNLILQLLCRCLLSLATQYSPPLASILRTLVLLQLLCRFLLSLATQYFVPSHDLLKLCGDGYLISSERGCFYSPSIAVYGAWAGVYFAPTTPSSTIYAQTSALTTWK